jgi:hypothetical protein
VRPAVRRVQWTIPNNTAAAAYIPKIVRAAEYRWSGLREAFQNRKGEGNKNRAGEFTVHVKIISSGRVIQLPEGAQNAVVRKPTNEIRI